MRGPSPSTRAPGMPASRREAASSLVHVSKAPEVPLLRVEVWVLPSLALCPIWLYRAMEGVTLGSDEGAHREGQLTEGEAVHVALLQAEGLRLFAQGVDGVDDAKSARSAVIRGALDRPIHRRHRQFSSP